MTKVFSVHSFRGGTGKSNVTGNLATLIARQGYRVGIIDTDIQSPGIHVPFGLNEKDINLTLNDYLWGRCAIEEAAYDVTPAAPKQSWFGARHGSVYLVPSSIKTNEIVRILREGYNAHLLNDGFQQLSRQLKLDYLFIDTHPGINEETLMSIIISNVLILILRPDSQDYQGTAVAVDVARKLNVPKMMLVLNKTLPSFNFDTLRHQLRKTYDTEVAGILPVCQEMFELGSSDLFCLRYPDHAWTKEVSAIAKTIVA